MVEATTRERISELVTSRNPDELQRIEAKLHERLDDLASYQLQIALQLKDESLSTKQLLHLMDQREQLSEDISVAKESLAYLRSCRRRQQERALREQLRGLDSHDEPSVHRKSLIMRLLRDGDEAQMQHLLNALMEKRGQIVAHREVLEGALQHLPIASFEMIEDALSLADDALASIDTDIPVLWRALNRSL